MSILLTDETINPPNMKNAGSFRYGQCFRYGKVLYMRVDSHGLLFVLRGSYNFSARTGTNSLNTKKEVLVLRLSNGKLSYFKRSTKVFPINLHCSIEELEVQG